MEWNRIQKLVLILFQIFKCRRCSKNLKKYSYDERKAITESVNSTANYNYNEGEITPGETVSDKCYKYNEALDQYLRKLGDIAVLEFWSRNIEVKKTYRLTPRQCLLLGF